MESKRNEVVVRIEVAMGSRNKYRVDPHGELKLSRVVRGVGPFPTNYGFVLDTYGFDNKEVDAFVLSDEPLVPGALVDVRVVAVFKATDKGEDDTKVLAVPSADPRWDTVFSTADLPAQMSEELRQYILHYKGYKIDVPSWEDVDGVPGRRVEHS